MERGFLQLRVPAEGGANGILIDLNEIRMRHHEYISLIRGNCLVRYEPLWGKKGVRDLWDDDEKLAHQSFLIQL